MKQLLLECQETYSSPKAEHMQYIQWVYTSSLSKEDAYMIYPIHEIIIAESQRMLSI